MLTDCDRSDMIEPLQIRARGLVFDALAAGPATGELVVLLHGFPQTSACWTPVLEAVAAAGYRAVAPDQRGYSPGARPTRVRDYRLPELVADVLAVADRLGADGAAWATGHLPTGSERRGGDAATHAGRALTQPAPRAGPHGPTARVSEARSRANREADRL